MSMCVQYALDIELLLDDIDLPDELATGQVPFSLHQCLFLLTWFLIPIRLDQDALRLFAAIIHQGHLAHAEELGLEVGFADDWSDALLRRFWLGLLGMDADDGLLLFLPWGLFGQGGEERRVLLLPCEPDLSSQRGFVTCLGGLSGWTDYDYLSAVVGELPLDDAGMIATKDPKQGRKYLSLKACSSRELLPDGLCQGVCMGSLRTRLWLQVAFCLGIFLLLYKWQRLAANRVSMIRMQVVWVFVKNAGYIRSRLCGHDSYDDDDQYYQCDDYRDTHAFLAAFVMFLRFYQILLGTLDIILAFGHVGLNAVDLLALCEDQSGKFVEKLNALHDRSLQFLDVPELVLDVADGVLKGSARLSVDFLLQHLLGQLGVVHILLQLLIINVPVDQSHLSGDFVLYCILELLLEILLPLQDLPNFLTQIQIKVFLHAGFRLIGVLFLRGLDFAGNSLQFLSYRILIARIFLKYFIHLVAILFFLCRLDGFGVAVLQGLDAFVVRVQPCDHDANGFYLLDEFLIDLVLTSLVVLVGLLSVVQVVLGRGATHQCCALSKKGWTDLSSWRRSIMVSSGIYRQFKGSYTPIIFQMQAQAEKVLPSSVSIGVTCEICYCNYQPAEGHELRPAGICYRCWLQHIRTFISQISYRVGSEVISPFQGREPIDVCLALKSLLPNDEAELQEFLFKKYCAFTADIEKCPSEACDYVFMMEACRWGKGEDEQCPKCQAVLTQAVGFDLKSLVGFVYFLFLTNKCPKCQIPIQKTTGCPHMSCPCGHQFCWYCLKDYYPAPNNVYSVHEPRECAAIFISKVIFIGICIAGIFLTLLGNEVFQRFMGYFFTGMAYIVHTLLLDLAIALNIFAINSLLVRHYNRSLLTIHKGNKIVIGSIIFCDLVLLLILYWFQLLIESAVILLVEATLVGVVALIVWLVIINIETWFKYIC